MTSLDDPCIQNGRVEESDLIIWCSGLVWVDVEGKLLLQLRMKDDVGLSGKPNILGNGSFLVSE